MSAITNASVDNIAEILANVRIRFHAETELQDAIETMLKSNDINYRREVILSPQDRIDFICGDTGVEVKIDGSLASVTRQVHRYSQFGQIKALLLVTSRSNHRNLPSELNRKPFRVLWIGPNNAL